MEMDESQIVTRSQNGDGQAFGQLYDAYVKKIYNFIFYRTHHRQTAEDLTAVVFMKALENIHTYSEKKGRFSSWLYQIARNAVIDHYRMAKSTDSIEDAWDIAGDGNIERDADTARQLEQVKKYLEGLPSQQRDVVIMRVWDGLSHREISEILGISEANSKMTFSRTIAKINKEFSFVLALLLLMRI